MSASALFWWYMELLTASVCSVLSTQPRSSIFQGSLPDLAGYSLDQWCFPSSSVIFVLGKYLWPSYGSHTSRGSPDGTLDFCEDFRREDLASLV
ncbi:hypothetical protein BaRGS_00006830 [Batillaria attramentaria]|uniref:Secreted protein n=1 Tax=Batillaria attramentaria TaxID=370345 RepID=A0ABD0LSC0_9CAEN